MTKSWLKKKPRLKAKVKRSDYRNINTAREEPRAVFSLKVIAKNSGKLQKRKLSEI